MEARIRLQVALPSVQSYASLMIHFRRKGDKLAENWVFIDLLYFLKQQGLDVLEQTDALRRR